ncbi:MAG: PIN domain-containing protein [Acidobacteriia bacterium]|nr:PIN domain-containing protein [Terriglobia bacterium]
MTLTYVDSGVLIFAAKGTTEAAALALPFLQDPAREFVTSEYVRLEVLPKPICFRNEVEVEFYNTFFRLNTRTIPTSVALLELAMEEACRTGLSALDAIHIACAVFSGAEEIVTSEKVTKPMHRTRLVRVVSIFPAAQQNAVPPEQPA